MKRCLMFFVAALVLTGVAQADYCPGLPPLGPAVTIFDGTQLSPVFSTASFTCGGLTFSNFIGVDGGSNPYPNAALTYASVTNGVLNLTFNPFLGSNQDLYLYFNVGGPVSGIGLTVGGNNATVIEGACSSPIAYGESAANFSFNAGNNCTAGTNLLASNAIVNTSGAQTVSTTFTGGVNNSTYIFKDIATSGAQSGVTSVSQSFQTPIPEPFTFILMGSGLAALGLYHRRKKA